MAPRQRPRRRRIPSLYATPNQAIKPLVGLAVLGGTAIIGMGIFRTVFGD